jgi:hypothetical protein
LFIPDSDPDPDFLPIPDPQHCAKQYYTAEFLRTFLKNFIFSSRFAHLAGEALATGVHDAPEGLATDVAGHVTGEPGGGAGEGAVHLAAGPQALHLAPFPALARHVHSLTKTMTF